MRHYSCCTYSVCLVKFFAHLLHLIHVGKWCCFHALFHKKEAGDFLCHRARKWQRPECVFICQTLKQKLSTSLLCWCLNLGRRSLGSWHAAEEQGQRRYGICVPDTSRKGCIRELAVKLEALRWGGGGVPVCACVLVFVAHWVCFPLVKHTAFHLAWELRIKSTAATFLKGYGQSYQF